MAQASARVGPDETSTDRPNDSSTGERILIAARSLLAEHGIAGTGMRTLAEAAGVSVPTLYNHFDSKSALVAAVFAREGIVVETLGDLPPLPARVRDRLAIVAGAQLDLVRTHEEFVRLVYREAANGTHEANDFSQSFVDTWIATWRGVIAEADDVREDVDLDLAAEAIKCAMWGIISVYLTVDSAHFDANASVHALVTTMALALTR